MPTAASCESSIGGDGLLGAATGVPFRLTLAAPAVGSYTVTAKAFDDRGAATASAPVAFAVVAPPPRQARPTMPSACCCRRRWSIERRCDARAANEVNGWLDEQFAEPPPAQICCTCATYSKRDRPQSSTAYEAIWQQWLFERGPAARAHVLRAVRDLRDLQHRARPEPLRDGLVHGHAQPQRLRQLPHAARGRDPASGHGLLPQHDRQQARRTRRRARTRTRTTRAR